MKEYNSSDILSKVTETSLLSDGHHTKAGPRVDIQKYPKPYPTPPHHTLMFHHVRLTKAWLRK